MFKAIKRFWIIGTVIIGMVGISCNSKQPESPILARVGQTTLSVEQFSSILSKQNLKAADAKELENMVYRWIDSEVLYQSALKEGVLNLPEIHAELKKIEQDLAVNYFLNQKLGAQPTITDEEISAYYDRSHDDFIIDQTEYRYFYLICKDAVNAQSLLRLAQQGETFEQLAKDNYPDKVVNSIWDSGSLPIGKVIPELQRMIERLPIGSFYGPIASPSGVIICQLVEKNEAGSVRDLKLVADQIRQRLSEERYRDQYQQLLVSLRNKSLIEFNTNFLTKIIVPDTSENKN